MKRLFALSCLLVSLACSPLLWAEESELQDSETSFSTAIGALKHLRENLLKLNELSIEQKKHISTLKKALTESEQSVTRLSSNLESLGMQLADLNIALAQARTSSQKASDSLKDLQRSYRFTMGFAVIATSVALALAVSLTIVLLTM